MLTPYPHQIEGAERGYEILKQNGLVYLSWEERTGKTITAFLISEKSKAKKILILTKKKALEGWHETLQRLKVSKEYTITNYHQAGKLGTGYDLIILDESHSYLAAYPKPGKIWKDVKRLTKGRPIIYLSATPYAESVGQLFNQLRLSDWIPLKYKNYYEFYRFHGTGRQIRTPYGFATDYKDIREPKEVLDKVDHLFLHKTRKELDFEHEPTDKVHYVNLLKDTWALIKQSAKDEVFRFGNLEIPLDSPMKQRMVIYQIEGGALKIEDNRYIDLPNQEKIDYIKAWYGDSEDIVIFYHFKSEEAKLKKHFKHAQILQGDRFAEGVDLSHIDTIIVYSMSFSTSRYIQRRARQANKNRTTPIEVQFLLVKDGLSEAVYNSVALKHESFLKNSYERWKENVL